MHIQKKPHYVNMIFLIIIQMQKPKHYGSRSKNMLTNQYFSTSEHTWQVLQVPKALANPLGSSMCSGTHFSLAALTTLVYLERFV